MSATVTIYSKRSSKFFIKEAPQEPLLYYDEYNNGNRNALKKDLSIHNIWDSMQRLNLKQLSGTHSIARDRSDYNQPISDFRAAIKILELTTLLTINIDYMIIAGFYTFHR
jgi:hypothetical protein